MRLLPRAIRLAKASLPFQQVAKASQRLCSRHQWVLGKSSLPGSGFLPFGQPPFSWARWIVDCGPHQCAMQLGIDFALLSYMGMDQHLLYHFGGAELLFASYAYTCMYVHIIYVYTYCIHIYVYSYCIYIYTSYIYNMYIHMHIILWLLYGLQDEILNATNCRSLLLDIGEVQMVFISVRMAESLRIESISLFAPKLNTYCLPRRTVPV